MSDTPESRSRRPARRRSDVAPIARIASSRTKLRSRQDPGNLLDGCERLHAEVVCDSVYLTQLIPLLRRRADCSDEPVTLPTYELDRLCAFLGDLPLQARRWGHLVAVSHKEIAGVAAANGAIRSVVDVELARVERGRRDVRRRGGRVPKVQLVPSEAAIGRISKELERQQSAAVAAPTPLSHMVAPDVKGAADRAIGAITDLVESALDALPFPLPIEARPRVGFLAVYRQDWCSVGYQRGRLIRSIPLTADSRTQINVKSWEIRRDRRETIEAVERDISTEIVGDEKWSHATTKQLSAELNQQIDANAKVTGEIPVKGATVGAEAGAGSTTSGSVAGSIVDTEERVHQATVKSADTLRKKTSSTVETNDEFGFESTTTETIVNPNKCNSLTYHFFEIDERYEVSTVLDEIAPVVMVPLPSPTFDAEWLLCHECLIRPHLPCATFYAGFDAARTVSARAKLGEFLGDLDAPAVQQAADASLAAMADVLAIYRSLRDAGLGLVPDPNADGGLLGEALDTFVTWGSQVLEAAGDVVEGAAEVIGDGVDAAGEIVEDVVEGVGDIVEGAVDVIGGVFGLASMRVGAPLPLGAQAMTVTGQPGGIGSAIWWKIAEIAAPELGSALAQLEGSYTQLASMPAGPGRTAALASAIQSFFTSLGDVDEVFTKIAAGLAVVGGVIAASAIAGPLLALPFLVAGGMGTAAAMAIVGVAVVASLTTLAMSIIAAYATDPDIDLVPDDNGLKTGINHLFGVLQQLGHLSDMPTPPDSDDPAVTAEYQRALAEAKQRRNELAEAQVELDRLLCHVREHRHYYTEVFWRSLSSADLTDALAQVGIASHRVEPRIVGFHDGSAAFRVTDARWLGLSNVAIADALEELASRGLVDDVRQRSIIDLPTRGVTVEPELGQCDACDEFVHRHRAHDLDLKSEEVARARLETQRITARLNSGLLGDPSPFDGADSLDVSVDAGSLALDAAPASGGDVAVDASSDTDGG